MAPSLALAVAVACSLAATTTGQIIHNFVSGCSADYAVLNNAWQDAPPAAGNCQSYFAKVPAGWELAPANDNYAKAVIRRYAFGFQQIMLADGSAYTTVGTNAAPTATNNIETGPLGLRAKTCAPGSGILIRRPYKIATRLVDFNLPLKTLILSSSPTLDALPQYIYNSYGAPADVVHLDQYPNGYPLALESAPGVPNYNAIVLTDPKLTVQRASANATQWVSALTPQQWADLRNYRARYGVRMVVLSSNGEVDVGLRPVGNGGRLDATSMTWINNDLSQSIHDSVPLSAVFRTKQNVSFWFPVQVDAAATYLKPFLTIGGNNVGAFVRECAQSGDGKLEEMHFTFTMNEYTNISFPLGDVWFTWVNRGLYLGQRRVLLDPQVDDVFLETGLYNIKFDRQAVDNEGKDFTYVPGKIANDTDENYRANATDMRNLVAYQAELNQRLPKGSKITFQFAFNGIGYYDFASRPENMNEVVEEVRDHFYWVSHTYSHMDLYCPFSDCQKFGNTNYTAAYMDMAQNKDFARYILFSRRYNGEEWVNMTDAERDNMPSYSPNSLITPRISGLNLSTSVQAMLDNGHRTAVGDNSRVDLKPDNIFHPFQTKVAGKSGERVMVIPRFATRVYFDCSTPEENVMEHNSFYGPRCIGYNETGPVNALGGRKCNTTTLKYDHDLTWDEVMDIEGQEVAMNLLAKRTDPYMFHQANLRFFWYNGKKQSLISIWIDSVLKHYTQYSSLPVFNMKLDDLRQFYDARAARDACGISGSVNYKAGLPTNITVTSKGQCEIKLTRSTGVKMLVKFDNPAAAHRRRRRDGSETSPVGSDSELYGPDETINIQGNVGMVNMIPVTPCTSACHVGTPEFENSLQNRPPIETQGPVVTTYDNGVVGVILPRPTSSSGGVPAWAIGVAVAVAVVLIGAIAVVVIVYRKKKAHAVKNKLANRSGPVAA
eukprot:comp8570_c0_seq1/m.3858 comp8570_c0_seq1/g.3858  ORF comp8570_c0_seq1/g.3858 comp8570_c0_seq1/m.3858 type:complete len:944 (-) comp8570_c0_seq1:455-3286(-)